MRYAVLSDIHSNLDALQAVLRTVSDVGADEIVCLGDLVGYLANPNECIDLLRSHAVRCVAGNHDLAAVGLKDPSTLWDVARKAVLWTEATLTPEHREYLAGLPRHGVVRDHFRMVHGALHETEHPEDVYVRTETEAAPGLAVLARDGTGVRLCFFGHTHRAEAFCLSRGIVRRMRGPRLRIDRDSHFLVNPGSVGLPRDRSRRASFLVYDHAEGVVGYHSVAYDFRAPRARARQHGLLRDGLPLRIAKGLTRRAGRFLGRRGN